MMAKAEQQYGRKCN